MPTLSQIFYTDANNNILDTSLTDAPTAQAVIDFLNATAPLRTVDVDRILFSPDGYMIYDRTKRPARKTAIYTVNPDKYKNVFDPPSTSPGYPLTTIARVQLFDSSKTLSKSGLRFVCIPGPVLDIVNFAGWITTVYSTMMGVVVECRNLDVLRVRIGA